MSRAVCTSKKTKDAADEQGNLVSDLPLARAFRNKAKVAGNSSAGLELKTCLDLRQYVLDRCV